MLNPFRLAIASLLAASTHAAVFDFEHLQLGTTVPFTLTDQGISATFSSPQGGIFFVIPAGFSTLTGNVLLDNDSRKSELDILFDVPVSSISLLFGLNYSRLADELTLEAFRDHVLLGSISHGGRIPPGSGFLEGSVFFSGAAFNRVRLSSQAFDFAIDDVTVFRAVSAVPEPSSIWFTAGGLSAGIILMRRRLRSGLTSCPK